MAAIYFVACNPPNISGPALKPTSTKDAFKGQVQCSAIRPKTEPDLMAWDPGERANLNEIRQQGLVVVRYKAKGCDVELQVLSNCIASGSYKYYPYNSSNSILVNNMNELYGKLPLGASRFAAKLHGDRGLRTDYELVGIDAMPAGTAVSRSDLRGDCQGATHVISKIYVGGFALDAGEKRSLDAAATIFGAGAGAGAKSVAGAQHLQSEGNPAACKQAMDDGKPEVACSTPLRIALLPLGAPAHECPAGSKWTGSGCQVSSSAAASPTSFWCNGALCHPDLTACQALTKGLTGTGPCHPETEAWCFRFLAKKTGFNIWCSETEGACNAQREQTAGGSRGEVVSLAPERVSACSRFAQPPVAEYTCPNHSSWDGNHCAPDGSRSQSSNSVLAGATAPDAATTGGFWCIRNEEYSATGEHLVYSSCFRRIESCKTWEGLRITSGASCIGAPTAYCIVFPSGGASCYLKQAECERSASPGRGEKCQRYDRYPNGGDGVRAR